MILAETARKDSIYAQLAQEKHLMQIEIDQLQQSNSQYQILSQEVSERADRLELEKDKLQKELESVHKQLLETKMAKVDQPADNKNENQTQFDNLQGNHPLMQSQADWQVVDPAKTHHEKPAKANTVDMMD